MSLALLPHVLLTVASSLHRISCGTSTRSTFFSFFNASMFEDFSFSSSRPPRLTVDSDLDGDDSLMLDPDSALISPLSSRCPSPQPSQRFRRSAQLRPPHASAHSQLPPTSVPLAYDHRRLSIGTLTRKLHEHTLRQPGEDTRGGTVNNPNPSLQLQRQKHTHEDVCLSPRSVPDLVPGSGSRGLPGYVLTPPDTDHDDDDGEGEGDIDIDGDGDGDGESSLCSPTPFLTPTSMPGNTNAGGGSSSSSNNQEALEIRTQRQQISRLQCNPTDVDELRRTLFSADDDDDSSPMDVYGFGPDDWHPSSLPPRRSPRRAAARNRSRSRPAAQGSSGSGGLGENSSADHQHHHHHHHHHGAASGGRRKSSSGALSSSSSSHRIDKGYYPTSRELRKKSEQGLRRKSLVSAALASMVERTL